MEGTVRLPAATPHIIALLLSFSAGCMDQAVSLLSRPSGFASFSALLAPAVATGLLFFLVFEVLWLTAGRFVARRFLLETPALALSMAVLLGVGFTLASLIDLFRLSTSMTDLIQLVLLEALSFFVATAVYFMAREKGIGGDARKRAASLGAAFPVLSAILLALLWAHLYRIEGFLSLNSIVTNFGLLLASILAVAGCHRIGRSKGLTAQAALSIGLVAGGAAAALLFPLPTAATVEKQDGGHSVKKIVLVTIDTLRADALSCYNSMAQATPHIDELAADGILFKRAVSPSPWTLPSLVSIMTALSPDVHLVTEMKGKLSTRLPTLAEYLQRAGYLTASVVFNDYLRPAANLSKGFTDYNFVQSPEFGTSLGARILQKVAPRRFPPPEWPSSGDLTSLAVDWIEKNAERDFFLWIHYLDPHGPYAPPPLYLPEDEPPPGMGPVFERQREVIGGTLVLVGKEREWIRKLYEGEVLYIDENIGVLVDRLKSLGIYEDALIILASDHGEEFWEHGRQGHGHTLYDELLRVPLITKLPQSVSRGVVDRLVTTRSIMPTVLDLCGIGHDTVHPSSGSLRVAWEDDAPNGEEPVVSTAQVLFDRQESVTFDRYKYIRSLTTGREELFDLLQDSDEKVHLNAGGEEGIRARELLKAHAGEADRLREYYGMTEVEHAEMDEETWRRLKGLGYIQ